MDGGNEQRVVIKFCFKAGLSATETLVLVQKAYGNKALIRSKVFRWYSLFRDGRELVEDDEKNCRPKSTRTEVNSVVVTELIKNGRRKASRMIAEFLNILKTVVLQILKEDLEKRKLCARFVPHSLTPEQRKNRVTSCQNIIAIADADNFFLTNFLLEMRPGVLSMTPKQSDRVLNELVRHSSNGETEISKVPHQDHANNFF
jgi:histone-lysine N-methyltransferase SETMAR